MDHRDLARSTRVPLIRTEYLIVLQPVSRLTFLKSFQHCPLTFALFNGMFYSTRTRLTDNRLDLKWTGSKAPAPLPGSDFWVFLSLSFSLSFCTFALADWLQLWNSYRGMCSLTARGNKRFMCFAINLQVQILLISNFYRWTIKLIHKEKCCAALCAFWLCRHCNTLWVSLNKHTLARQDGCSTKSGHCIPWYYISNHRRKQIYLNLMFLMHRTHHHNSNKTNMIWIK